MQNKPKSFSLQKLGTLSSSSLLNQPQMILDHFFITQQLHNRNSLLHTTRSLVKLKRQLDVEQSNSSQRGELSKRLRFSVRERVKKVSQMRQGISQNILRLYDLEDKFDKLSTKLDLVRHDQATLLHILRRSQIQNQRHLQLIKAKLQLLLELKVGLFKGSRQLRQTLNERRELEGEVQQLMEEERNNRATQEEYRSTISQIIKKNETELYTKQVHDQQYFIKRENARLLQNKAFRQKCLAAKLASVVLQRRLDSLLSSATQLDHSSEVLKIKGKVKDLRQLLPKFNQEKASKGITESSIAKRQKRLLELQQANQTFKLKLQQLTIRKLQQPEAETCEPERIQKEERLERVEWRVGMLQERVGVGREGELQDRLKRIFCIVRQELQ